MDRAAPAPQNRADAGEKLAWIERLGQIVVGADLKADDPIRFLAARGQHQDWRLRARPDIAADFEAIEIGQHHVENDGVERRAVERGQTFAAGETELDSKTGRAQIVGHHGGQPRIVVNDEKAIRHDAAELSAHN